MLVGEIGIPHDRFMYGLCWWQIKSIVKGYRKRERTFCVMTRWATFMQMCTGMADLTKAGIYEAQDLIRFEWEKDSSIPEDEVVEQMREKLLKMNKKKVGK